MSDTQFLLQMKAYSQWRDQLVQTVKMYQKWRSRYGFSDGDSTASISNILASLRTERVSLAFVGEFSRGKTELINALFFSKAGVRLLPSAPGRTTMCPTELFYDRDGGSYIRLLPIETRLEDTPLNEFKNDLDVWEEIDLDIDEPEQMQNAFRQLVAVKEVNIDKAKELGMYHDDMHANGKVPAQEVQIPRWRHALISFPHPLLKQGLSILDTPGLNSLGTEPELTLTMLPNAHAVIFVLAADTGVTKSDLDVWRNHVCSTRSSNKKGLAVVMNKVDALWDDLAGAEGTERAVQSQVGMTASTLGIDEEFVFPVSAKQALLAKIKSDLELLGTSRLGKVEEYLSNTVLRGRRAIIRDSLSHTIGKMVDESMSLIRSRLDRASRQLDEFQRLDVENQEMTTKLMAETRDEQSRYMANVENFQASRRIFAVHAKIMSDSLTPEKVADIIRRTRKEMERTLTTYGMKNSMKQVFEELRGLLQDGVDHANETRRLVKAIYKKFQDEHGFGDITPSVFSIKQHQFELEQLFEEGEVFR
ncbi:MAG: dynamin family protein, partial [Pseudomonadota bacterium]